MAWWVPGCQGSYSLKICKGDVDGSTYCAWGRKRGSGVCMAGLGLLGKRCPHQRKRRKQLEEEEPK